MGIGFKGCTITDKAAQSESETTNPTGRPAAMASLLPHTEQANKYQRTPGSGRPMKLPDGNGRMTTDMNSRA